MARDERRVTITDPPTPEEIRILRNETNLVGFVIGEEAQPRSKKVLCIEHHQYEAYPAFLKQS